MGIINFSIPKDLVLAIKQKVTIDNFVETGTFRGGTSFWAADFFKKIYTIEISLEISKETASQPNCPKNIDFIVGDSRQEMPKLVNKLVGRSLFWLDGHWCSGAGGKDDECPLTDELKAIATCENPIILIDDARCFLGPLPPPHNAGDWPMVDEIFAECKKLFPNSFTTIIDDVIICVPEDVKPIVYEYWINTFSERYYGPAIASQPVQQRSLLKKILTKGKSIVKETIAKPKQDISNNKEWIKEKYIQDNKWLTEKNIASVLDIGANTGQFAEKIRWILPDAKIYSFEPIPFVFNKLKENFANDANFKAFNVGLGDEEGTMDFYLNEFSDSSSFLKMNKLHKTSFPFTEKESLIKVDVKKLDDVLDVNLIEKPYLLKLDVQGFEEKVINGGKQVVENADYIITEVTFIELYDNQPLFDRIYSILKEMGFQYMGNFSQLTSKTNKEILQADAIFKKIK